MTDKNAELETNLQGPMEYATLEAQREKTPERTSALAAIILVEQRPVLPYIIAIKAPIYQTETG